MEGGKLTFMSNFLGSVHWCVGTFVVQIAKSFGDEVTGVCSPRNLNIMRLIDAELVIDYTREDFTKKTQL